MSEIASVDRRMTPEVRRGVWAWILKAAGGLVFFTLLLFLLVGRWTWVWGWIFLGLLAAASAAHVVILLPINPALLAERSRGLRAGGKTWDKIVVSFAAGLLPLAAWGIAPLDVRFGWSPSMPLAPQIAGAIFFALGWAMILWATASNTFFSTTVRIQEDRGHTVQTSGPYQFVRHPGYVGALLYQLATPFLLGSWWALVPMVMSVPLYLLRTALEDRMLHKELEGYAEYAQQTRYRLVPGAW